MIANKQLYKTDIMKNYPTLINEFTDYVISFYNNKNGIYPIASINQIKSAVNKFIETKPLSEFHFDSFDRETVRCILQPSHSIYI